MKKTLVLITILLSTVCSAQFRSDYRDLDEPEVQRILKEDVSYLSSAALEGRKAGSEGESDAADYVSERLSACGIELLQGTDLERFGMVREGGDTLRSRNVIGFIPGYDRDLKDHYIVIGARLDNVGSYDYTKNGENIHRVCYGANGNASGLAMLIQLASHLNANKVLLKRSVLICAFGASLEANAGSWYFLNRAFKSASDIDAMINLDMLGTVSNGLYAYTASNIDMNRTVTDIAATLQPVTPVVVSKEPCPSDHRSFYDREIPSVMFTTGMFPEYNTDRDQASILEYDGMERIAEFLYNYSVKLINGPKPVFRYSDELKTKPSLEGVFPYSECDYKPSFLGSTDPSVFLKKWVYVYLRYPDRALRDGIQGRVLVDFVIDEKGKVRDVKVRRGVDPDLDDEAVRVISASPDWKPGRIRGQKVKTQISIYVEFRLEKKK